MQNNNRLYYYNKVLYRVIYFIIRIRFFYNHSGNCGIFLANKYENLNLKDTATLLIDCKDQKDILAAVTDFLQKNGAYIISLDEHVDHQEHHFFMRVEWRVEGFNIPREKIGDYFETLVASKFDMRWSLEFSKRIPKIAIFVSKHAHCFFDILSRWESKEWKIEIPVIISNHDKFRYVAERYDIPYHHIPISKTNKKEQEEKEYALMKKHNIDLIVLARYMQVISDSFIERFPNRIINIHHSSLPAFAGARPYDSAYERGVKIMGATSHYITEELDAGPIIAQDVISISHMDSIRDMKRKGKDIEKTVLAKGVWAHINHKIITYKNKTVVFP